MKKRLKINGVITFCVLLLISVFPEVFFRKENITSWNGLVEVFGIALILLGQLFRACARGYKSEWSPSGESLIQTGPYAFVRNPMYLGILLIGTGIVLVLFKWWVACIFLLFFVIRYLLLTLNEEKTLLVMFPKEYAEYKRKVPRIFPALRILVQRDIGEYLPIKFIWLKRELGTILAVLLTTLLVESWEDIRNAGIASYLFEALGLVITILLFVVLVVYLSRRTVILEKNGSYKSKSNTK